MRVNCRCFIIMGFVVFVLAALCSTGCNRAALRIPGASTSFPSTATQYKAKTTYPYTLVVAKPMDQRTQHYGEQIGGTGWTGCSTDALWVDDADQLIQRRLVTELTSSGLFSKVTTQETGANDLVMRSDIYAFCSQVKGFLIARVAGISSLQVSLEQKDKVLLKQKFEKVVTDADKEYTGPSAGFIEQAMVRTMSDSLRELMKGMLNKFETEAPGWSSGTAKQPSAQPISGTPGG